MTEKEGRKTPSPIPTITVTQELLIPFKIVFLGDQQVGKTSLIMSFTTEDGFDSSYTQTVFDCFVSGFFLFYYYYYFLTLIFYF